jgi:hypothetical protein
VVSIVDVQQAPDRDVALAKADTSACPYDSGAPYFLECPDGSPVLVSVESTGPDCPHTTPEDTDRVDTLVNWIRVQLLPRR